VKTEIISKIEALENESLVENIIKPLREVQDEFRTLKTTEAENQKKAFLEQEGAEEQDFVVAFPEDFDAIQERIAALKEKVKEFRQKQAEEEKQNLLKKENILERLQVLISQEENIGKAFADFKVIRNEWEETGKVPGDKHKDIQAHYNRLVEDFYYNINIYKSLQDYDLKKNYELKAEIIERTKKLIDEDIIKNIEPAIKAIQKEWSDIGPVPREVMDEQKKEFWSTVDLVYDKIKGFYKELKSSLEENYEKKQTFVEKAKEILTNIENFAAKEWQENTDTLVQLQKDWKEIGPAPKKQNEEIWQEFRTTCDKFFEEKKNFFEGLRKHYDEAKEVKEKLIAQAEKLKDSKDWKNTTDQLIKLQKNWKDAGPASQKYEQDLWKRFRAACDHFFNRKKEFFSNIDENQQENLVKKEALLAEIESFTLSGTKEEDLKALKEFSTRWNEIDFVPRKDAQRINNSFSKLMDEKYKSLDLNEKEMEMARFKHKFEPNLKGDDAYKNIDRERRFLREKIKETEGIILQYENNLGFISNSKSAEGLRRDVEKKIARAGKNLEIFKDKLRLLNKMEDQVDEKESNE
jgi:hypothetical protein